MQPQHVRVVAHHRRPRERGAEFGLGHSVARLAPPAALGGSARHWPVGAGALVPHEAHRRAACVDRQRGGVGARDWRRSRRSQAPPPHAGGAAACGGAPQRATPRRPARRHAPRPARNAHHETCRAATWCCRRGVDGPARSNDRAAPCAPAQPSEPRAHARGRLGVVATPSAAIVVASTSSFLYPLTTGRAPFII